MNFTSISLAKNIPQRFPSHAKDYADCIQVFFAHTSFLRPLNIPSKIQHGNRRVFVPIRLLTLTVLLLSVDWWKKTLLSNAYTSLLQAPLYYFQV